MVIDCKWDDDTLAYAAGFLDGEGCFSTYKRGKYMKISVSCANTNLPIIEWFKSTFGGSICKNATRLKKPHHRRTYSWAVTCKDADRLCKAIVRFLKQKTEEALLLIAIQQTMGMGRLTPEIINERDRLALILKGLKHVTWS